jgi:hypothetical protein
MPSRKVDVFEGLPILNDSAPASLISPRGFGKGLDLAGRPMEGPAYGGLASAFPKSMLIPRSEWKDRIAERKKRKLTNRDVIDRAGLPCKNQATTNYCWINSPGYACECVRVIQNQPMVILSPASGGAPIKDYQNVGGWGLEAIRWISQHGLVPVDRWPANAIDRSYATAENAALALQYRAVEWTEVDMSEAIDQIVSSLLNGFVGCAGLAWWRHEVTYEDVDWIDNAAAIVARNSWGPGYGKDGHFILQGDKMRPSDYVFPRSMLAA